MSSGNSAGSQAASTRVLPDERRQATGSFKTFIPPIALGWAEEVNRCSRSGKTWVVASLLCYRRAITRSPWVTLPRSLLRRWQISPKTYLLALSRMEAAGLVVTHKSGRKSTRVRILDDKYRS